MMIREQQNDKVSFINFANLFQKSILDFVPTQNIKYVEKETEKKKRNDIKYSCYKLKINGKIMDLFSLVVRYRLLSSCCK